MGHPVQDITENPLERMRNATTAFLQFKRVWIPVIVVIGTAIMLALGIKTGVMGKFTFAVIFFACAVWFLAANTACPAAETRAKRYELAYLMAGVLCFMGILFNVVSLA